MGAYRQFSQTTLNAGPKGLKKLKPSNWFGKSGTGSSASEPWMVGTVFTVFWGVKAQFLRRMSNSFKVILLARRRRHHVSSRSEAYVSFRCRDLVETRLASIFLGNRDRQQFIVVCASEDCSQRGTYVADFVIRMWDGRPKRSKLQCRSQ